jgi:hypothetical protein
LPIKRDISCLWTWRMENVWSVCQWFSTSLPADIQFKAMKSIAGFQDVSSFIKVMQSNMITFRQRSWDILRKRS